MNNKGPLCISAALLAAMILASVWALGAVPPDTLVAVHFNVQGEPDGFLQPMLAFASMPAVAVVLIAAFAIAPRFARKAGDLSRSRRAYAVFWITAILLLALVHTVIIAKAAGLDLAIPRGTTAALGIVMIVTGNMAGKIHPNAWLGVRTPWTLASGRNWASTHRVYGWGSVSLGAVLVGLSMADAPSAVLAMASVGGMLALAIGSIAYSRWSWHRETT